MTSYLKSIGIWWLKHLFLMTNYTKKKVFNCQLQELESRYCLNITYERVITRLKYNETLIMPTIGYQK